jgi:hypothetical protein
MMCTGRMAEATVQHNGRTMKRERSAIGDGDRSAILTQFDASPKAQIV